MQLVLIQTRSMYYITNCNTAPVLPSIWPLVYMSMPPGYPVLHTRVCEGTNGLCAAVATWGKSCLWRQAHRRERHGTVLQNEVQHCQGFLWGNAWILSLIYAKFYSICPVLLASQPACCTPTCFLYLRTANCMLDRLWLRAQKIFIYLYTLYISTFYLNTAHCGTNATNNVCY